MHECEALALRLRDEIEIYEALLDLGRRLRAALIERRVEDVEQLTLQQDRLMARAQTAGVQTREAIQTLASAIGMTQAAPSIGDVAAMLPPSASLPLLQHRSTLSELIEDLGRQNLSNAMLLESAMDAVRFTFLLLGARNAEPNPCYDASRPSLQTAMNTSAVLVDCLA